MTASISQLPINQRPISEQFRLVAKEWLDAENAAHILEEMKTTTLEQRKCNLIDANPGMPEAKATRLTKADREWEKYIRNMCAARARANLLKKKLEYVSMRFSERQSAEATARKEYGLSR